MLGGTYLYKMPPSNNNQISIRYFRSSLLSFLQNTLKLFQAIKNVVTTKAMSRGQSKFFRVLVIVLLGLSFVLYFSRYDSESIFQYDRVTDLLEHNSGKSKLIVPTYFLKGKYNDLLEALSKLESYQYKQYEIFSMSAPKLFPESTLLILDYSSAFSEFRVEKTHVYDSATDIKGNIDECRELESDISYSVSRQKDVTTPASDIVKTIIRALDDGDEYVTALEMYFHKKIRLQLKHQVSNQFWFRLAGNSVWLKEYGLHLMVSRVVYSEYNKQNQPTFSISYTQLFTDDWVEVKESLLIPTNLGSKENKNAVEIDGAAYTVRSYPMVLPVPFPFDIKRDYQGPEDPRILLVKNERGHEEPLIIFNQYHQTTVTGIKDGKMHREIKGYRNMWISWPWQFQLGKSNVDNVPQLKYDSMLFNRASEIMINGVRRDRTSKNWSGMTSSLLRQFNGYDKSIFLSTRYPMLEVLKCDITTENANCEYMTIDGNRPGNSDVGPLRGGTAMVNINLLISEQTKMPVEKLIRNGREIWVGFARAHFRKCGCGDAFYRPNIVVVILDLRMGKDGKVRQVFSLSHVSSFMGLHVDILPWNPEKSSNLCSGVNVLIPNGIGYWKIGKIGTNQERNEWLIDDMLTLDISVSDMSVGVLKIKGILESLVTMSPNSPFKKYEGEHNEPDLAEENEIEETPIYAQEFGASDDVIMCALKDSERFCRVYGEKHPEEEEKDKKKPIIETERIKNEKQAFEAYKQELKGLAAHKE